MEKLTPQELREFAVCFEDRQALLNSSEGLFRFYDEEEKHAQADEESLPEETLADAPSGPPDECP